MDWMVGRQLCSEKYIFVCLTFCFCSWCFLQFRFWGFRGLFWGERGGLRGVVRAGPGAHSVAMCAYVRLCVIICVFLKCGIT